ncbi:MAG: hypothetical protein ACR2J8_13805 [Thermomicrobiales bacterium]
MTGETFDKAITTAVASRRGALAIAGAAVAGLLAGRGSEAVAVGAAKQGAPKAEGSFSRSCDRFILVGENKRKGEWNNVDDNMKIELFRKGSKRSEILWDDTSDNNVNNNGVPFKVDEFDARVGDKIQITAYNLSGGCELDEIWLFCADGGTGRKVHSAVKQDSCASGAYPYGQFFQVKFRIKP